ncbi:hypothetical protein LSAT2_007335, partial [Lamellibrachia satsuma]
VRVSCYLEVEDVTTHVGRFRHVLLEINLTEKVSEIANIAGTIIAGTIIAGTIIAGTIIAVVYVEVTENDTFNLLCGSTSKNTTEFVDE